LSHGATTISAMKAIRALALTGLLAVGCTGISAPSPTPGSMDEVIANIVLQDVTVLHLTSGDAGCPQSGLHDNAVHLELVIGSQSASHEVYLLRWKNQREFDDATPDFTACLDEYRALNPGSTVSAINSPPWRVYGPSLNGPIGPIIFNALRAAGGGLSPSP
jgi:hypothetical protein